MSNGRGPGQLAGGGSSSFSSKMMRQIVESAPSVSVSVDLSELPEVPMPSLEGLEIHVPAAAEVTEQDILERFEQIYYTKAVKRTPRAFGESIQLGDELVVDLLGFLEGRIIPFSANQDLVLRLEPDILQPTLGTQLVGTPVGDTKVVTIGMADEDEFGQQRQLTAAFVVEVKAASTLEFPPADAPESLEAMGFDKDDINHAYRAIAENVTSERGTMMFIQGTNMALNAAADRIKVPVPHKLIQDEIRSAWSSTEGQYLMQKGLSRQDMDTALEGWLQDEETQQTARQRLKVMMVLLAFAREDEQAIELEELEGFVNQMADTVGVDIEEWRGAIADDGQAQFNIINSYVYIRTMFHLVAKIPVHYAD